MRCAVVCVWGASSSPSCDDEDEEEEVEEKDEWRRRPVDDANAEEAKGVDRAVELEWERLRLTDREERV